MRILGVLMLLTGLAAAQEGTLTELEVLRGRALGMEQAVLIERRTNLLAPIQERLDALNKAIAVFDTKIADVEQKILAERKLDPAKYRVNWQAGKVEEKKEVPAK